LGVCAAALREHSGKRVDAIAVSAERKVVVPTTPYRGIHPFRYVDHEIFFARERDAERLTSLVAVYRGTMLYGMTGAGKSSLINAGLLPHAVELGFSPERVRVQPRAGEALVVERISTTDDGSEPLPSLLAGADDGSVRVVLSTEDFERRIRVACAEHRPLLVFDQFEELCTLFETQAAGAVRRRIVDLLVRLLRAPLPVKLLFVFREDYLGKVKQLLAACPELVDQALVLAPLAPDTLPTIIRGPFERYPGHFARELAPVLAERLRIALGERFGVGELSLSEVQTVCLRLWQATDPDRLLAEKGVQGLLEDYLGEALDAFPPETRFAAVALLGQMVTPAGTRNVISAEDLVHRVREEDSTLSPALLGDALNRLDRESRLVRRERRRDLDLYEITSEFLVPWISNQRAEARRLRERRHDRRRLLVFASVAAALLLVIAGVVVLALEARNQSNTARRERNSVTALALSSAAVAQSDKRIDVPLLLALGAYGIDQNLQSQDALMRALIDLRKSGAAAMMHGHRGPVQAVAVSPDGGSIASAGTDGTVRLWSVRTHRQVGVPFEAGATAAVATDVAFMPDGNRLATGSDDGTVSIWDLASHHMIVRLRGHAAGVAAIAISPDGKRLAFASYDETVRIWDLVEHRQIASLVNLQPECRHLAFSPDGSRLVTGTERGDVQLWSVATHHRLGRPLLHGGDSGAVNAVAFSRGGLVASGSEDGAVHFWNAATRTPVGDLRGHPEGLSSFAFSRDGKTLASATWGGDIQLWSVASGAPTGVQFHNVTNEIEDIAFAPDGTTLATAGWDGSVGLWPTHPHGGFEPPLSGHEGTVNDVAFSPDGTTIASAGADDTVRLWSAKNRTQLASLTGHTGEVKSVAFNRNGTLLASGSTDGSVRLWTVAKRASLRVLSDDGQEVSAVAFSRDGKMLASATSSGMVRLWDVSSWRPRTWSDKTEEDSFVSLAFSRDRKLIATGGGSGTILLWNVATGKQVGRLHGHTSEVRAVAFSPLKSDLLASASEDETVRLWNTKTQKQVGDALRDHKKGVDDVTFSPDGRLLASAGEDNAVRLWDADSGAPLGVPLIANTEATVKAVAFDRDGTTLASASEDGEVRLWPGVLWRGKDAPLGEICQIVGGSLSQGEWTHYVPTVPYRKICRE
jgi:WD40 repeat protein